jgi:hypothetical protein
MLLSDPDVTEFMAYVLRSLKQRRRMRDRPNESVLSGARKMIEAIVAEDAEDSSPI